MVCNKRVEAGTLIFTEQCGSDDVWSVTCSAAERVLLGSRRMQTIVIMFYSDVVRPDPAAGSCKWLVWPDRAAHTSYLYETAQASLRATSYLCDTPSHGFFNPLYYALIAYMTDTVPYVTQMAAQLAIWYTPCCWINAIKRASGCSLSICCTMRLNHSLAATSLDSLKSLRPLHLKVCTASDGLEHLNVVNELSKVIYAISKGHFRLCCWAFR